MNPRCTSLWHPDEVVDLRFRWIFPLPVTLDPAFRTTGERLGLSARVTELLAGRGLANPMDLEGFFALPPEGLHDPHTLPDAAAFAGRIALARRRGERVMVFGDFDADGLTGLAILCLALRRLGMAVEPYVPSRLEEGHGLSLAAIASARKSGASVV